MDVRLSSTMEIVYRFHMNDNRAVSFIFHAVFMDEEDELVGSAIYVRPFQRAYNNID